MKYVLFDDDGTHVGWRGDFDSLPELVKSLLHLNECYTDQEKIEFIIHRINEDGSIILE